MTTRRQFLSGVAASVAAGVLPVPGVVDYDLIMRPLDFQNYVSIGTIERAWPFNCRCTLDREDLL